jgi:hypothetical protein
MQLKAADDDTLVIALTAAILLRRPDEATKAVLSLLASAVTIARGLSAEERIAVAEIFRDAGDAVEQRCEPVEV